MSLAPIPQEGRTTSRTKSLASEMKHRSQNKQLGGSAQLQEGMKGSKNTFHGYKHYMRGQTMKTRKKPNTTSKTTPQGVQTASMVGQGGKEHLEGPLVAS